MNTKKKLLRARKRAVVEAKELKVEADTSFRYRHEGEMRKMLKGIDLDRFEALAEGRLP